MGDWWLKDFPMCAIKLLPSPRWPRYHLHGKANAKHLPSLHPPQPCRDCGSHNSQLSVHPKQSDMRTHAEAHSTVPATVRGEALLTHTCAHPLEGLWVRHSEILVSEAAGWKCGNNQSSVLIYLLNTFQDILTKTRLIFISGGRF